MGDLYWIGVLSNIHNLCGYLSFLSGMAFFFAVVTLFIEGNTRRRYMTAAVVGSFWAASLFMFAVTPDRTMVEDLRKQVEAQQ